MPVPMTLASHPGKAPTSAFLADQTLCDSLMVDNGYILVFVPCFNGPGFQTFDCDDGPTAKWISTSLHEDLTKKNKK